MRGGDKGGVRVFRNPSTTVVRGYWLQQRFGGATTSLPVESRVYVVPWLGGMYTGLDFLIALGVFFGGYSLLMW